MQKLKESENPAEVAIGIQGERLQKDAGILPRSKSHETVSDLSWSSALIPVFSRSDNSASSTTSLSSSSRVGSSTYSTPLIASRCPCGVTGICGCPRRAESQFYKTKKSLAIIDCPGYDQEIEVPTPLYAGTAWFGYGAKPNCTLSNGVIITGSNALEQVQQDGYPVHEDDMIGKGNYRYAKSVSRSSIVGNALEKSGGMIDIFANFAGDEPLPGYSDITYAELARIKHDRDFPREEKVYRQEVSDDGTFIQHGFPFSPEPLKSGERLKLYLSTWSPFDRRDFNTVRNLDVDGNLRCSSLFNSRSISAEDVEVLVGAPLYANRQVPPLQRLRGSRIKWSDQQRNRTTPAEQQRNRTTSSDRQRSRRPIVGRAKVASIPPKVENAVVPLTTNNIIVPPITNNSRVSLNNAVPPGANDNTTSTSKGSVPQGESDSLQTTTFTPNVIYEPTPPQLVSQLENSKPSTSCTQTICENRGRLARRPAIRRQPSGLRNEISL